MFNAIYRAAIILMLGSIMLSLYDIKQLLRHMPAAVHMAGVVKTAMEELDKE